MNETSKRYNKVLDIINKRLIPDIDAKKARGEVFTPLSLVQEMILGIRRSSIQKGVVELWGIHEDEYIEDDEEDRIGGVPLSILRDAGTKWLDPANGIGNFPVVAFYILDFQIGHYGKKEFRGTEKTKARHEHIVQNMLYMIELNKGNVNASIKIFKLIAPDVKANICCADTLDMTDEKLLDVFKVNRFDVVMGNPPFNQGGVRQTGDRLFYHNFISYGFNHLRKDGCLVFIHPPNFHRIQDYRDLDIKSIFDENHLRFLRIIANSRKYFEVTVSIDYYVLQKGPKKGATILDDNNILSEEVDISKFSIVPNFGFPIIKKLMALKKRVGSFKPTCDRVAGHHSTQLKIEVGRGEYPVIHLITNKGFRVFYSKAKHKYQDTPKVLINGLGTPYVFDDTKGRYGTSQIPILVLRPSRKDRIFLFSKLFQYLNSAFMIKRNISDQYLYGILPDFDQFDFTDEETLMDALGLSEKEKVQIQKIKMPVFTSKELIEVTSKTKKITGGRSRKIRSTKPVVFSEGLNQKNI